MTEYGRIHTDGSRSGGQPMLKPCPFCGSLPKSGDSTYGYWLIFCSDENNCLAQPSVGLKTEAEAIAAWNTRQPTQSDVLKAAGDAIRGLLDITSDYNLDSEQAGRAYAALHDIDTALKGQSK